MPLFKDNWGENLSSLPAHRKGNGHQISNVTCCPLLLLHNRKFDAGKKRGKTKLTTEKLFFIKKICLKNVSPAGFVLLVFEPSIGCGGGRGRGSRRAAAAPAAAAAAVVIRPPGELILLLPPLPSCSSSASAAADYFAAEDSLGSLDDADLECPKLLRSNKFCFKQGTAWRN